jgi:Ni/Fe-hydrogenase 1 B-type cytochrome subunit
MEPQRIRVCVWEPAVRFTHWINFLCIIALSITGFYIGNPFIHAYASEQYIMGWMRFIHFAVSYVFLMSVIIRIYWAFAGNEYASWKAFFQFGKKGSGQMKESVRFYLLFTKRHSHMLGHSALAGATYLTVYLLFIFEIISGFALYSLSHPSALLTALGGWLLGIMSVQIVRLYHHLITWALITFTITHIYVAWFVDLTERNGLMGSIFGGYKFVTKGREL